MTAKTTPRPWRFAEYASPRGTAYICGQNDEKIVGGGLSPSVGDAALITRAVNSHALLVSALKSIVCETEDDDTWTAKRVNAVARAAVARGTGKNG